MHGLDPEAINGGGGERQPVWRRVEVLSVLTDFAGKLESLEEGASFRPRPPRVRGGVRDTAASCMCGVLGEGDDGGRCVPGKLVRHARLTQQPERKVLSLAHDVGTIVSSQNVKNERREVLYEVDRVRHERHVASLYHLSETTLPPPNERVGTRDFAKVRKRS